MTEQQINDLVHQMDLKSDLIKIEIALNVLSDLRLINISTPSKNAICSLNVAASEYRKWLTVNAERAFA